CGTDRLWRVLDLGDELIVALLLKAHEVGFQCFQAVDFEMCGRERPLSGGWLSRVVGQAHIQLARVGIQVPVLAGDDGIAETVQFARHAMLTPEALKLSQAAHATPDRAGESAMPISQNVSPDKPLTVKQTKFAAAVASGVSKSHARKQNYVVTPGYEKANSRQASKLSRQPNAAAEIRRLTWLAMPNMDDFRGMRAQAIRVISDLSRSAKSEEVRLKSALALIHIAETTRAAAAPTATPVEQDRILDAL